MTAASEAQISRPTPHSFTLFEQIQKFANFSPFIFNHFHTLFRSCKNNPFICIFFRKNTGVPLPRSVESQPSLELPFQNRNAAQRVRSPTSSVFSHFCVFSLPCFVYEAIGPPGLYLRTVRLK